MKLIGLGGGLVACRELPEEYIPDRPPPTQDIINLVRETYQFASFPILQPGMNLNGPFMFAGGRFTDGEKTFGISQLLMMTEGDIIGTSSTDDSDMVMDHLMTLLDRSFGYHLRTADTKRSYLSTMVVEFDKALTTYIKQISEIEKIIDDLLPKNTAPRRFKNVGFGREALAVPSIDQISGVENADFIVERRAGVPFSSNRFYCSAPMRTRDHIHALEQIEAVFRGDAT